MGHRHYFGSRKPLSETQRTLLRRALVVTLFATLLGLAWQDITRLPPPLLAVTKVADCIRAGYSQAVCVDINRTQGDWRY